MQDPKCGHWTALSPTIGRCAIGGGPTKQGGDTPGRGYCLRACELGPKLERLTAGEIVHGAAGLAKAAMGINRADDATIAARTAICKSNACGKATVSAEGNLKSCSLCNCMLRAKLSLKGESCPIGKWGPIE